MKRVLMGLLVLSGLLWGAASAGAQGTCAAGAVERGVIEGVLTSGGIERHYLLYVPESYDPAQPTPLVLSLHGFASNPGQQMEFSVWNDLADEHGFLVAYPQGTGFPLRWNTDQLPDAEYRFNGRADDVTFISDLIDRAAEDYCLDQARVYATGLSNGGGMSNRLACELADRITAIGTVAGAYPPLVEGCNPSRPVPVMAFHGTEDTIVPYEGAAFQGTAFPAIPDWAAGWAERDGCDLTPEAMDSVGEVDIIRYVNCEGGAQVILHTVNGGGHNWPGGGEQPSLIMGNVNCDVNASERMWAFFEGYSRDD